MKKENILKVLKELRKEKKRKFSQTVDLIINLRNFDIKKQNINLFANLPHKVKEKKVCAFLNKKSDKVETIIKTEFGKYKGKEGKKLVKKYDFFIAVASLMPAVATSFGRVLGPAGKMPSPQLGILMNEEDKAVGEILEKINKTTRIKSKEPSLKIAIGKENMKDEEIAENALTIYNAIFKVLPRKKENLKSILIKFTMGKPAKVEY
jgi:large subunit ribosomal protein L1